MFALRKCSLPFYKGMASKVTITKVGGEAPLPPPPAPAKFVAAHPPLPAAASRPRRGKSMKTFPRGVLKKTSKIKPVRNPTKPPPMRKDVRKHTIRVLTEKGMQSRRKTLRSKIQKMRDEDVREKLQKAGVSHNPKTPPTVLREMLEGGVESGMISLR